MSNAYVNDIGTAIIIDMGIDISTGTGLKLIVRKPDATEVEWTPEIYQTQFLKYVVIDGDLDQSGQYIIQPYLTLGSWSGYGKSIYLTVKKQFN